MAEELLGPIADGWLYLSLGEVCKKGGGNIQTGPFGSQLHAADYVPVGIPSIMPQNIGSNRIFEQGIARITLADAKRLSRYRVETGDIVYSRRGDVERSSLIREREDGWLCGTGCLRVRVGAGVTDPAFAAHYLGHPAVREWIVRHAHGATMANLNTSILSACPFVLPPLTEQRAIASILDAFDDKIDLNHRMNETLEALARAIFKDWFVDFGPTGAKMEGRVPYLAPDIWALFPDRLDDEGKPQGWALQRVEDLLDLAYGKALPATNRIAGDCPVYGSGGITGYNAEALISGPSVIVGRKGTVGSLYWEDRPCFPIDTVFYVVPKRTPLTFCFYLLQCLNLQDMNTDAAVPGLNRRNVYRLVGPWGSPELIANFDAMARPLRGRMSAADEECRTLVATRDFLLPKLMSGEIRVKDAEKVAEAAL